MKYALLILVGQLLSVRMIAQSSSAASNSTVTDKNTLEELQKDFDMRHSTIPDIEVTWYTSVYGYYGKYTINENSYISRYDTRVDFIETLVKKPWNETVPPSIRNSFAKSEYGDWSVDGFWEVVEPDGPGYYLEVTDKNGKITEIWTDGHSSFTTVPNKVD